MEKAFFFRANVRHTHNETMTTPEPIKPSENVTNTPSEDGVPTPLDGSSC
jgi:hypothetical protein